MGWSIHHPVGLIHHTPAASYRGYTLFANTRGGKNAYLIDMNGDVVHSWHSDEGIHYAYLLDNGNLLCRTMPPEDAGGVETLGGSSASILELDWDGNIVWTYRDETLHHDFERLPNGNTLICEGAPGRLFEVTPRGEVVWEYINPFFVYGKRAGGEEMEHSNATFRCHRYGPDHPALAGRDLDPARYASLNRLMR